jgi:hypothetical protein
VQRIAAFVILFVFSVQAANIPMTLVSEDEAEPMHSAIVRKEAWTIEDVRRLRAEAEKRMREGPWSVTAERPAGLELDLNDYYSDAPYWWPDPAKPGGPYIRKEGQVNPDRFVANRLALNAMSDAVFTLGTAAYLLDEPRYAQRAVRVINTWFVNPNTRMSPSLEYSQAIRGVNDGLGTGAVDGRVLIRAIQGMEFLAQTRLWAAKDQAPVKRWFEEYLRWLTTSRIGLDEKTSGNNHASWWTAQVAAIATFVNNAAEQKAAFNFYRSHIFPRQIHASSAAAREEGRALPLAYSPFNLEAFAITCRIAQLQGVDLWSVKTRGGLTFSTVIDSLKTYLSDSGKWNKEQAADFSNDSFYFLAFAGMGLKQPAYVAFFRQLEKSDGAWLSFVNLVVGRWEAAAHQTRH